MTNFAVLRAVDLAVLRAVYEAVYWAVYMAVYWELDRIVCAAIAEREAPPHPGLAHYLGSVV